MPSTHWTVSLPGAQMLSRTRYHKQFQSLLLQKARPFKQHFVVIKTSHLFGVFLCLTVLMYLTSTDDWNLDDGARSEGYADLHEVKVYVRSRCHTGIICCCCCCFCVVVDASVVVNAAAVIAADGAFCCCQAKMYWRWKLCWCHSVVTHNLTPPPKSVTL